MNAERFTVHVEDAVLADLRRRLTETRWPEDFRGRGWADGASIEYLISLVDRWHDGFDWRAQEAAINAFPHFRVTLDGVALHFVHVRGRGHDPLPLVLTHGWPSTFYEYLKIAPLLADPAARGADPADSFDVVVPSLPGYPFSGPLPHAEFRRVTRLWARLMTEVLGYERFGAYGGDIGGMVTNRLALEFPQRLTGIATSFPAEPYLGPGAAPLSEAEEGVVEARRLAMEGGRDAYVDVSRTHPARLAVGLNDSPAGLAAWLVWFWREWSDCDGDVERRFTKDEL
jgi:pimeloyl-ACP methyl ester carboxylesterase